MDKKPVIILAFANDSQPSLPHLAYLADEIKAVQSHLGRRDDQVKIISIYKATIPDLSEVIEEYKDRIVAFMYSGHSEQLQIDTAGDAMSAIGLANELGVCPELKLVLINGCSSKGHMPYLLQNQIPYIIATEAPIDDKAAAFFSATFWKELSENNTVGNAFELGLRNAQKYRTSPIIKRTGTKEEISRSLDTGENESDIPWLLETSLPGTAEWSLSDAIREFQQAPAFQTNKLLTETLYQEFAERDVAINRRTDYYAAEYLIFSKFPPFITKYIHDLCATQVPSQASFAQTNDYFIEPDLRRLIKMTEFFRVLKELVKSMTLAEIREELLRYPNSKLPDNLDLRNDQDKNNLNMATIVAGINFLKGTQKVLVKEITGIDQKVLLDTDKFFRKIIARIEKTEKLGAKDYEKLHPKQASESCKEAEAKSERIIDPVHFFRNLPFRDNKKHYCLQKPLSTYPFLRI